jgi:outer membrane protein OmpA-like peptidoglycan-associated protein
MLLPLVLLAACTAEDYSAKSISKGFKGSVDWVRDAFGQPVADVGSSDPQGPFPNAPNDPRPVVRSEKARTDMINDLKSDEATAGKITAALDKSDDKTRYLAFNGAPPTAQPIALSPETVNLPDGVRDMDTVDRTRLGSWSEVAAIPFKEGSAELPDDVEASLGQAARLAKADLDARVVGYSDSDRLVLPGKGPHEANRYLAELRARKVADALIRLGVPANKVIVGSAPEAERKSGDKVEIIIDY